MRRLNTSWWTRAAAPAAAAGLLACAGGAFAQLRTLPLTLDQSNYLGAEMFTGGTDDILTILTPRIVVDGDVGVDDFNSFDDTELDPGNSAAAQADLIPIDSDDKAEDLNTFRTMRSIGVASGTSTSTREFVFGGRIENFPNTQAAAAASYVALLTGDNVGDLLAEGAADEIELLAAIEANVSVPADQLITLDGSAGLVDADLDNDDIDSGVLVEMDQILADYGGALDLGDFSAFIVVLKDNGGFDGNDADTFQLTEIALIDSIGPELVNAQVNVDGNGDVCLFLEFDFPVTEDLTPLYGTDPSDLDDPGTKLRVRDTGSSDFFLTLESQLEEATMGDADPWTAGDEGYENAEFEQSDDTKRTLVAKINTDGNDDQAQSIIAFLTTQEMRPSTGAASMIVGIQGENATNQADDVAEAVGPTIVNVTLLQGSGSDQFGTKDVIVAVQFSGEMGALGDSDALQLFDAEGNLVGTSDDVTDDFADAMDDVAGLDDESFTDSDDILYYTIDMDGDFVVNSDGTVSPSDDERDVRSALFANLDDDDGVTKPSGAGVSGEAQASEENSTVDDGARPCIICFGTQSDMAGQVPVLMLTFDEEVQGLDAENIVLAYEGDIEIADLTNGLNPDLSVPTADTAELDFEDRILQDVLGGVSGNINGVLSGNTYVDNDTFFFNAPPVLLADEETEILTGSGDEAYEVAFRESFVEDSNGLGNAEMGNFMDDPDDMDEPFDRLIVDDAGNTTVKDMAKPWPLAAIGFDNGTTVTSFQLGFSEDVDDDADGASTDEAESYFFLMDLSSDGVRMPIPSAEVDDIFDNIFEVDLNSNSFAVEMLSDPGVVVGIFNPGFPIEDVSDKENEIDPNEVKTLMFPLDPPAITIKAKGIAEVDPITDKVLSFTIKTTGEAALSEGGSITDLLTRFFVRGIDNDGFDDDEVDGGDDTGRDMDLAGLINTGGVTLNVEEDNDGCFLHTFEFMDGMPFTQEDFLVEYVSPSDNDELGESHLVDLNGNELASKDILICVIRPPVNEGDETPADGNVLTMTITGDVFLGEDENVLGTRVKAWVWKPISECGKVSFTYKGVRYTGEIEGFADGEATIAAGTRLYFHPQIMGNDYGCDGTMYPMGVINSKPDLDIMYTVELDDTGVAVANNSGNTANNGNQNGSSSASANAGDEREELLYKGFNLSDTNIIKPIALTIANRGPNDAPGRFTFTGSQVSNGVIQFVGEFEEIGETVVTAPANEDGSRPYILHTRGEKGFKGCPVVIGVDPEGFFSDIDAFLANNLLVRRLAFTSDIDRITSFTNADPVVFNIDATQVHPFRTDEFEFDDWVVFPAAYNNAGQDFGTTSTVPNRVNNVVTNENNSVTSTPINSLVSIPAGVPANGYFLCVEMEDYDEDGNFFDDEFDLYLPYCVTALTIDTRGVFCADLRTLNRIATGYSYAIEDDELDDDDMYWFAFGVSPSTFSNAQLSVVRNTSNGGWNSLANIKGEAVDASAFGGQVQIVVTDNGARVWAQGFGDVNDLDEIGPWDGPITFSEPGFVLDANN